MAGPKESYLNGPSAMYNTEKLIMEGMPSLVESVTNPQAKQLGDTQATQTA